jgi:hypothetical protein
MIGPHEAGLPGIVGQRAPAATDVKKYNERYDMNLSVLS